MKETRLMMDMPITVEIVDATATEDSLENVFSYFQYIDEKFSTYKETSEITAINKGSLTEDQCSNDMRMVLALCEETKQHTNDYFDIRTSSGSLDPSGLVKGWAIHNAALLLKKNGFENFYVEAGGDVQLSGRNRNNKPWEVGIQDPFSREKRVIKILYGTHEGVATSGTYIRGQHIYNPHERNSSVNDIVSLTVIGPNIYEADRFATAAFAMGKIGIHFIEQLRGFEGYVVDAKGMATMTSGFQKYTQPYVS